VGLRFSPQLYSSVSNKGTNVTKLSENYKITIGSGFNKVIILS